MFAERMATGKTRLLVEISDSNLLRLSVMQLFEYNEGSFSDYLDDFLGRMIDKHIESFFEDGFIPGDSRAALLNELQSDKKILCGHSGISIELDSEEADSLLEKFEDMEYRSPIDNFDSSRLFRGIFLNTRKHKSYDFDHANDLIMDILDDTGEKTEKAMKATESKYRKKSVGKKRNQVADT